MVMCGCCPAMGPTGYPRPKNGAVRHKVHYSNKQMLPSCKPLIPIVWPMDPPEGGQRSPEQQVGPYRGWTLCLTAPFFGLGYPMDPIAGQQPHISIYKVRRSAVRKLIALIFKVLLDDGNRILILSYDTWQVCSHQC